MRVEHHVADDLDAARDLLAVEDLLRAVVGREEQLREPVGLDPVVLLRHRVVVAAQPGLDVRQRDSGLDRGPRATERRVRVAVDEHPVRPLRGDRIDAARAAARRASRPPQPADLEPVARLAEPELLEEHPRQLAVVVLPRVHDDLVDSGLSERLRHRPGLDELGPVPHDRQHFHSGYTTQPAGR